jgi:hypothetical protein
MANGTFGGGNGTQTTPFLIEDIADLNAIRTKPTLYYKLVNNLDMKGSSFNDAVKGWTPISSFSGYFDGNYHNIRNLTINDTTLKGAGLFADITTKGELHNLGLIDVSIKGGSQTGSFAGSFSGNNVTIDRCYVNGKVEGTRDVGGVVGQSRSRNNNTISNVVCDCQVIGTSDNVGGICGEFTSITDDDKTRSIMNAVMFYNTVSGNNFITTNAMIGLADAITSYSDCFYDSSKVSENYPDEHASGQKTAYFYGNDNFKKLITLTYIDNDNKINSLWNFSSEDYPRLGFANKKYTLFKIDNVYNYYDFTTNAFVPIDGSISTSIFFAKGINPNLVETIPQTILHDTMKNHAFQVFMLFDTNNKNVLYPYFKTLSDKVSDTKKLRLTTINRKDLITTDFNPVSSNAQITTINEVEATSVPVAIRTESNSDFDESTLKEIDARIFYDKSSVDSNPFNVSVQSNTSDSESSDSALNDNRTISIMSSKANEYSGINLKVASDTNNKNTDYNDIYSKIIFDKSTEKQNIKGNVFYTLYNTITTQNRGIHVNAEGENKSKYLLSVSNGKSWLKYDTTTNNWVTADLANIYEEGISAEQLASRAIMNSLPTDYKSKIKYAACISSEAFNTVFSIKDINIEFEPNSGPTVLEASSTETDDNVTISGTVFDNENDDIQYRILTKHQIETEWKQLLPTSVDGWFTQKNNYSFKHSFPLSSFKNGTNAIKIQTKDSRGTSYEKIISFTLIGGNPEIKINSNNQFYANATITHSQNKKVHYKIFINGEQKAPLTGWTEYRQTPFTFDYTWQTSDVLNGLPNEIEIVVEDEMQSQAFTKFNIVGEYKSLLFKDENNFYYSTDTGEILQQLDFGTVVGGVLSNIYPVWLENKTGLPMENITIFADSTTQEDLSKIKVSFTTDDSTLGTSFVPAESIVYDKIIDNNDVIKFYVRIDSDDAVKSLKNKVFRVLAKGDPIDSSIDNPQVTKDTYTSLSKNYDVLKDGLGLYNIKLANLNDTKQINGKNIFIAYDKVYVSDPNKVSKNDFLKSPVKDSVRQQDYTNYLADNASYQVYSIDWLNDFCKDTFNDTFNNLTKSGKLSYEAKLEYNAFYDGHYAWLKADSTNASKTFTHKWTLMNS